MSKTPKVVSIAKEQCRLIACDSETQRLIISVGGQRFALDFFSCISKLPAHAGDKPATVLPINLQNPKKPRR